jgi:hypothetical protein
MTKIEAAKRALRVWCAERGKTQTWVARRVGMHHTRFSRILAGHEKAPGDLVARVRDLTGISLVDEPTAEVRS